MIDLDAVEADNETMKLNELRAERGEKALSLHPDRADLGTDTVAEEMIADILHAVCDESGCPPDSILERAAVTYRGDAEDADLEIEDEDEKQAPALDGRRSRNSLLAG